MPRKFHALQYFGVVEPQLQKILVLISVVVSDSFSEDRRVLGISESAGCCFLSFWTSFSQKLVQFCHNESFVGSVVPLIQTHHSFKGNHDSVKA